MFNTIVSPLKFKLLFVSVLMLMLYSCHISAPGVLQDGKIDASLRTDFHKLNDELLSALKAGDPKQMEDMLSRELLESHYINRQAHLISLDMKNDTYEMMTEYYMFHDKKGSHTINGHIGKDKYEVNYDALTEEMYMVFFLPKKAVNKTMITAVYCKYNYGWKLFSLNTGRYAENNKNTPQLLKDAQKKYKNHQLVDAVLTGDMARECSRPNDMWHYTIDYDVQTTLSSAVMEANQAYKFPYTLNLVPTHPRIIHISNKIVPEGVFPVVYYLSSIKVSDTAALKRENLMVQQTIGKAIPGINQNKKFVYYTAYNEMPNYKKAVDSFEMVERME